MGDSVIILRMLGALFSGTRMTTQGTTTTRINKQKHFNRNELPTSENGNATQPNIAQPNNPKETQSQEQKVYLENLNRIMNCVKSTLPS